MEYKKLKESLYIYKDTDSTKLDEELLNELAQLIETMGLGRDTCFRVYCEKFCLTSKHCSEAIKNSIIEILENEIIYKGE